VDEISGKWMKTAVSSEADENNYISDRVARRSGPMEKPDGVTRVASDTH
jgi:hypothetical protein